MDDAAALEMVEVFIGVLEASKEAYRRPQIPMPSKPLVATNWAQTPEYDRLDVKIAGTIGAIVALAHEVDLELAQRIRVRDRGGWPYGPCLTACQELAERLKIRPQLERVMRGPGPVLDATQLHPWVWLAAERLWANGHFPEAVRSAAARILDEELPKKLGVPRGGSSVGEAFSEKEPSLGSPRLRFASFTHGTDDWRNAHNGARLFGMGCEAGIRNLVTHGGRRPDEREALEMLAALSVLARWIDEAEVVTQC
jgi:hypothetical protein